MALTPKQACFVQEYLTDLNATQAAIRAGYSAKTADRIGPELLGKTCVSNAIQKAIKDREKRTQITQDSVLAEIGKVAFHKASDTSDSDLKVTNKLKALDMLARHLGMYQSADPAQQNIQDSVQALADVIQHPAPNRNIKDFEE